MKDIEIYIYRCLDHYLDLLKQSECEDVRVAVNVLQNKLKKAVEKAESHMLKKVVQPEVPESCEVEPLGNSDDVFFDGWDKVFVADD